MWRNAAESRERRHPLEEMLIGGSHRFVIVFLVSSTVPQRAAGQTDKLIISVSARSPPPPTHLLLLLKNMILSKTEGQVCDSVFSSLTFDECGRCV